MRSMQRDKQKIWFSKITENHDEIDTIVTYEKPKMKRMVVSSTSGTPEELAAGIIPSYDRYITSYDKDFCKYMEEGVVCWVDAEPALNLNGTLKTEDDETEPITPPDYRVSKIIGTKKGNVVRYGISKINGAHS